MTVRLFGTQGFQIFCHWKERQEQAARYGETTDVEAQGLLSEVTHSRISDTASSIQSGLRIFGQVIEGGWLGRRPDVNVGAALRSVVPDCQWKTRSAP